MSEPWHILRKDLRRLRWPLMAWVLIVAGRMIVATTGAAAAFGNLGLQLAVDNLSVLVTVIDLLMLALIVSWLVHDEPLVGVDAFWLTRPIDPLRLMAAKLVFAAVFLVAAPVAVAWIARLRGTAGERRVIQYLATVAVSGPLIALGLYHYFLFAPGPHSLGQWALALGPAALGGLVGLVVSRLAGAIGSSAS